MKQDEVVSGQAKPRPFFIPAYLVIVSILHAHYHIPVRLTFLLGPAGTGKTFQCLHEIRQALKTSPEGPPLIFLAPKQATFQLETELLADPELPGYTRLKIVSFDTLAELILAAYAPAAPKILNDEGRVMVLRALLARHYAELKIFRASARLPGFAQHLSRLLIELQHYHFTPQRLREAAASATLPQLAEKLHDLALLLNAYQEWLDENDLHDPNTLLSFAAELAAREPFHFSGLWLDGFAEMTPQEIELLAALVPACDAATLAFCLGQPPKPGDLDWLSIWSGISKTFQDCHARLANLPGVKSEISILPRRVGQSRFENNPIFAHLEQHWPKPRPFTQASTLNPQLSVTTCPNPEAEAVVAAREILKHVQNGGRFRETAVLVRNLDNYHHILRRVFNRYEIPFFLDRRESISHHPLAELARYTLRLAIYGWEHDDWFGILKTGLVHENPLVIDRLENAALAHGWRGREFWRKPIEGDDGLENIRQLLVPPFEHWLDNLRAGQITGSQFAAALRNLWSELDIASTLEQWSQDTGEAADADAILYARIHGAVPQEMERWLENIELAFVQTALSLADWLGIVDAGLASLTVGVVPPALDQVLIGAIDRSRNPDLKLLVGLGLNELVFPAVPGPPPLLSEPDRKALLDAGLTLGPDQRLQIGRERFLGYILCTRATERLALTYARRNGKDKPLNPSIFIGHLQQLFPALQIEEFRETDWRESVHANELIVPLLKRDSLPNFNLNPNLASILERWRQLNRSREVARLSAGLADKLYGPALETSISDLEEYAACPFKFFVRRGLRAAEREEFEIDVRQRGSFQHEIMMAFHRELQAQGRRWRDISPAEAREWIARIGGELQQTFRNGIFAGAPDRRFNARLLIRGLQDLITVLVGWAPQYLFEPTAVELGFGLDQNGLQPWRIQLEGSRTLLLRGRIDRVDLHQRDDGGADVAVIDYKSSGQELKEIKLKAGLDLQLLAYLGVLRDQLEAPRHLQAKALVPAGAFYVRLRPAAGSGGSRAEVLSNREEEFQKNYQHRGRFQAELIQAFDNRNVSQGNQFKYKRNKDGALSKAGNEALAGSAFAALVEQIKGFLVKYGREIYDGNTALEPYRLNRETACEHCDYSGICRFDPWIQPYRNIKNENSCHDIAGGV